VPAAARLERIGLYGLWALIGSALLLPTLLFYFSTMRYLADFSYALLFLACLGFWIALDLTRPRTSGRSALGTLALLAAILSAILGLLLAVTGYTARFEHVNPQLFEAITRFFAW
jgi:vacuolar-type H+-ATPase subunit I/STV1